MGVTVSPSIELNTKRIDDQGKLAKKLYTQMKVSCRSKVNTISSVVNQPITHARPQQSSGRIRDSDMLTCLDSEARDAFGDYVSWYTILSSVLERDRRFASTARNVGIFFGDMVPIGCQLEKCKIWRRVLLHEAQVNDGWSFLHLIRLPLMQSCTCRALSSSQARAGPGCCLQVCTSIHDILTSGLDLLVPPVL